MNSLTRRVRKLENDPSQVSEYERSLWLCDHFGFSREWVEQNGPPKNLADFYEMAEWLRENNKTVKKADG